MVFVFDRYENHSHKQHRMLVLRFCLSLGHFSFSFSLSACLSFCWNGVAVVRSVSLVVNQFCLLAVVKLANASAFHELFGQEN